jgi:hypothetical protein
MTKKTPLTFEQHEELGRTLEQIRNALQTRYVQVANAYPQTGPNSVAVRKLKSALADVNEARSALDSAVFREYPEQAETTVYYTKNT